MGLEFSSINDYEAASLERPFAEEEIKVAHFDMSGDKAPSPDGFTTTFWQCNWDIVKEDILSLFREFHANGRFVRSLNTIFLVLVPKKVGAEDLKDYRPISLVGSLYKWIAKILSNRLKSVMGKLVNVARNAFVEGKQILDASLIANEVVDSIQKKKERGVLCVLDIEKAYDNISWSFIIRILKRMRFGAKWVEWIRWSISTATFFVQISGSPCGFFRSLKGLRQGDPLSPYLFVLVMEVFSILINKAVEGGFFSGYKLRDRGGNEVQVSHLLFADDTLVFCEFK